VLLSHAKQEGARSDPVMHLNGMTRSSYHLFLRGKARPIEALSLEELADLTACAMDAGETFEHIRTDTGAPLEDEEFLEFLLHLAALRARED
jgi:hypothetical protein